MKIPTFSSTIRRREMDAVLTQMVNDEIGPGAAGEKLSQFAREFFDVEGAFAFRSPAIALEYALNAILAWNGAALDGLSFSDGDIAVLSPLSPAWHFSVLQKCGFSPQFVDTDSCGAISVDSCKDAVSKGAKLVLLHDPLGFLPDSVSIAAFCEENGVALVEDVSESVGAFFYEKEEDGVFEGKRPAGSTARFSIVGLEQNDPVTAGGGAILLCKSKQDAAAVKKSCGQSAFDLLPDVNCALAFVQLREFERNELARETVRAVFENAVMKGRHSAFSQCVLQSALEAKPAVFSFPVVIESAVKEVSDYSDKKGVEICSAFENCSASLTADGFSGLPNAKSLYLRTVLFPLYPRLNSRNVEKIEKLLSTLP